MTLGRILIAAGLLLVCVGAVIVLAERTNFPLGRLPGDLLWRQGNTTVYFPIVSCVVISLVCSLIFWLFGKL